MGHEDPAGSPHHDLTITMQVLSGLVLAISWLLLLVLASFSSWAVGLGLLGVVWALGSPSGTRGRPTETSRRSPL